MILPLIKPACILHDCQQPYLFLKVMRRWKPTHCTALRYTIIRPSNGVRIHEGGFVRSNRTWWRAAHTVWALMLLSSYLKVPAVVSSSSSSQLMARLHSSVLWHQCKAIRLLNMLSILKNWPVYVAPSTNKLQFAFNWSDGWRGQQVSDRSSDYGHLQPCLGEWNDKWIIIDNKNMRFSLHIHFLHFCNMIKFQPGNVKV